MVSLALPRRLRALQCCRLRVLLGALFVVCVILQMSLNSYFTDRHTEDTLHPSRWQINPQRRLVRQARDDGESDTDEYVMNKIYESIAIEAGEITVDIEDTDASSNDVIDDSQANMLPDMKNANSKDDMHDGYGEKPDAPQRVRDIRRVDNDGVKIQQSFIAKDNAPEYKRREVVDRNFVSPSAVNQGIVDLKDIKPVDENRPSRLRRERYLSNQTLAKSRESLNRLAQKVNVVKDFIRTRHGDPQGVHPNGGAVNGGQGLPVQDGAQANAQGTGRKDDVVVLRQWKMGTAAPKPSPANRRRITAPPAYERQGLVWDKIPVMRLEPPSSGKPWPEPACFRSGRDTYRPRMRIRGDDFRFVVLGRSCIVLDAAIARYTQLMVSLFPGNPNVPIDDADDDRWRKHRRRRTVSSGPVRQLNVELTGDLCGDYPRLEMDESYVLSLNGTHNTLRAPDVWGLLRGLETFIQFIHRQPSRTGHDEREWYILQTACADYPRFAHRGILIDTSRHYLSINTIKKNIDAMEMNKFNVLHWHIVDDQSFPYQSQIFPDLSKKGSYGPKYIYTPSDILNIVEYARLRGIRVIPEFDSPGHTESWDKGVPGLLTLCPGGHLGPVNPVKQMTYSFFDKFFREAAALFPDEFFHLGGDESGYYCWSVDGNVTSAMKEMGMESDFSKLFSYYVHNLQDILRKIRHPGIRSIVWQEVYEKGTQIPKDSIVQIWKDDYRVIRNLTAQGVKVIYSSCWYLNYIKYGADWKDFYVCDPAAIAGNESARQHVLGGEACMWSEFIDDSNMLSTLWPRACAVAERLWSDKFMGSFYWAERRYEEQRCRMLRRGIPVPTSGPSPPCEEYT